MFIAKYGMSVIAPNELRTNPKYKHLPHTTSNVKSEINGYISTVWPFCAISLNCPTRMSLCLLKTFTNCSKILKWKVGVMAFRRAYHFLPAWKELLNVCQLHFNCNRKKYLCSEVSRRRATGGWRNRNRICLWVSDYSTPSFRIREHSIHLKRYYSSLYA